MCNEAPHCQEGLFVVLPEGICITQEAQAINCGSLGNMPCDKDVECQPGLMARYGPVVPLLGEQVYTQCSISSGAALHMLRS